MFCSVYFCFSLIKSVTEFEMQVRFVPQIRLRLYKHEYESGIVRVPV